MAKSVGVAVCLGLILALAMVVEVRAAGCSIFSLSPCLPASKVPGVAPTRQCCTAVMTLGQGASGPGCLCTLAYNPFASANGVNPDVAMSIPLRCRLPIPRGYRCRGKLVPGA